MKFFTNKQSGQSMMSVLVSIGLLGVFTALLGTGIKVYNTQKKYAKSTPVMTRYALQVMKGGLNVLMQVKDGEGPEIPNVEGICALVDTNAKSPGVGKINIHLFPTDIPKDNAPRISEQLPESRKWKRPFSIKRWQEALPGWVELKAENKDCKGRTNWKKCWKPKSSNRIELSEKRFKEVDITGVLEITPTYTTPLGSDSKPKKGQLFSPISLNKKSEIKTDVKNIGFKVQSRIYYTINGVRKSKILRNFIWAPQAGTCDYLRKNPDGSYRPFKLSLSGTGSSDPDGLTIYNTPWFGKSASTDLPLSINYLRTQAQEGVLDESGSVATIATNEAKTIAISCNEHRYRCPQIKDMNREYSAIDVTINAQFNSRNTLGNHTFMYMKPKFMLSRTKSSKTNMIDPSKSRVSYAMDGSSYSTDPVYRVSSGHVLKVKVSDKSDSETANNICRKICKTSSDYNDYNAADPLAVLPHYRQRYVGYTSTVWESNTFVTGCTACYMKNCQKLGLGTFGKMNDQPNQPLDSRVPECWAYENSSSNNKPYQDSLFNRDSADNKNTCVYAEVKSSGDVILRDDKACTDKLPVMCYNYGKFFLARKYTGSSWALKTADFSNASDVCFQTGREVIPKSSLDSLAATTGYFSKLSQSGGNYNFVNLALQGMFLAPQLSSDIDDYQEWATENSIPSSTKFWVALSAKDGKNQIKAAAPKIAGSADSTQHAVYYTGAELVNLRTYGFKLDDVVTQGGDKTTLMHHIKFKGASTESSQLQPIERKFLCYNPGPKDWVISDKGSKEFDEGSSIKSSAKTSMDDAKADMDAAQLVLDEAVSDLAAAEADLTAAIIACGGPPCKPTDAGYVTHSVKSKTDTRDALQTTKDSAQTAYDAAEATYLAEKATYDAIATGGTKYCRETNSNYEYRRPETPMDWINAMLTVEKTDEDQPFAGADQTDPSKVKAIWVAD